MPKNFPVSERQRCNRCDKVRYASKEEADNAAAIMAKKHGQQLATYYLPSCKSWHVTRQVARAKRNVEQQFGKQMKPRDYQEAAVDSLFHYFERQEGNPIIAMPTGTGKSIVIGEFIRRACGYPGTKVLILTHVKELIEQNFKKLLQIYPTAAAGVYSAGLKRRDSSYPITFAGIQSVASKAHLFGKVDLVIIDECHLVSPKQSTRYQKFLDELKMVNPSLKVIGLTATAYRLGQGMLTDEGGIFTDICFDATTREGFQYLLQQGWLAPLIPKKTSQELNVDNVAVQAGEFVLADLQEAVDKEAVTYAALQETLQLAADRKHWLIFATGVEHAEHVASQLDALGISATCVHSQLTSEERDKRIRAFKTGQVQAMVNNNILTTGFDYPEIDCIVMLRPTASPGLWVQMLGRGTRPAPGKENCLVLDFARNTARLGPIDDPVLPRTRGKGPKGIAPVRLCDNCGCYSHASARVCEVCGMEFPRMVKITAEASVQQLISTLAPIPVEEFAVDFVSYTLHKKEGKPDSMKVVYHCGLQTFREYICLDHEGYARRIAKQWWEMRCPWGVPPSVHDGMKAIDNLRVPTKIKVMMKKQYPDICGYEFT